MYVIPLVAAAPFALLAVHMVRIARRSQALPDRLLAAFFVLLACGIPPRLISLGMTTSVGHTWTGFWWTMLGSAMIGSSLVCMAAFTWKVFRPVKTWAKRSFQLLAVMMVLTFAAGTTSLEASEGTHPVSMLFNALGVISLGWAFVECVLYYRMMRRRREIGIANPIVVNRFLLWSLWTGALGIQGTLQLVLRVALWMNGGGDIIAAGGDPGGPWLALIQAVKLNLAWVGPTIAVSVWLSFTPPAAYRRWITKDAPEGLVLTT